MSCVSLEADLAQDHAPFGQRRELNDASLGTDYSETMLEPGDFILKI